MIFISHRAADKHIADALMVNLASWGVDQGHLGRSPVKLGDQRVDKGITQTLVRTITEAKVFFLIYTRPEDDWSWNMWELGVASDPAGIGPRVIVFQCTADGLGPLLAGFRSVKLDVDDLQQLVEDFHRQTGFVPGLPAFSPWIAEEAISRRTRALHAALNRCALSEACVVERASEDRIVLQGSATERVFLCHSSGDKSLVRTLYEQLRRDGFDPWLDEKDLLGGQEWETEIQNAIRRSGAVIVCLSKASLTRTGFVQKEIKIALDALDERPEGQVFVIPIRLEPCDIPGRLKAFHCLDCFDEAGYQLLQRSIRGAFRGDTLRRDLASS